MWKGTKNLLLMSALLSGAPAVHAQGNVPLQITICGGANSPAGACREDANSSGPGSASLGPKVGDAYGEVLVRDANGEEALRMPLKAEPLLTPPGWSGPTSPPSTATPTVTTYWYVSGSAQGTTTYTSPGAAAEAWVSGQEQIKRRHGYRHAIPARKPRAQTIIAARNTCTCVIGRSSMSEVPSNSEQVDGEQLATVNVIGETPPSFPP